MKKTRLIFTALAVAFSIGSMISAFKDAPALTRMEKAALIAGKVSGAVVGAGVGMTGGAIMGASIGSHIGGEVERRVAREEAYEQYGPLRGPVIAGLTEPEAEEYGRAYGADRGVLVGAAGGIAPGGYIGYKAVKPAAILALAKRHGVSYRVEVISQYYNINISQYKPILIAAEQDESDQLLQAIEQLYPQRFGAEWKSRLQKLFNKYRRGSERLMKRNSFSEEGSLKDFLRFVELGAAMSNLYFKTNPNPKETFNSAVKLYRALDLLK